MASYSNTILSHLRECLIECFQTYRFLSPLQHPYESFYLCRKRCLPTAVSRFIRQFKPIWRVYQGYLVHCLSLYFRHRNKSLLEQCIDRVIEYAET